MKKIILKTESCIGCGACVAVDPDHFNFSEDGYSEVISQENLESPILLDAIDACPVAIISMEEVSEETIKATKIQEEKVVSIQKNTCENSECHCNPCTCEDCNCQDEETKKAA